MRTDVKTAVLRYYLLRMLPKHMSFHSDFCLHAVSYHLEVTMTLTMTMVMLLVMADDNVGASHLHNPPRSSHVNHGWQREVGVRATLKLKFTQLPDGRKILSHIARLGSGAMPHFIRASFQVGWWVSEENGAQTTCRHSI